LISLGTAGESIETIGDDGMSGRSGAKLIEYKRVVEKRRHYVSCCILARDEEELIDGAIESVRDLADEVIVVDTGSTDRTVCFAKNRGARVYRVRWNEDFSEARNVAIAKARYPWILVLDADESLAPLDRSRLTQVLSRHPGSAFALEQRTYTECSSAYGVMPVRGSRDHGAPHYFSSEQVRIFPNNGTVQYRGRVHESTVGSLAAAGMPVVRTDFVIHHYGRVSASNRLHRKCSAYLAESGGVIDVQASDARFIYELSAILFEAGELDEAILHAARGLSLEPGNWEFLNVQGMALLGKGNIGDAERCFRRALEASGSNPDLCNNLGVALVEQKREREAVRFFEEGIALSGGNANMSRNAASACLALGMFDRALAHISDSLALDPFIPQTHIVHAEVLHGSGDMHGASQALEKIRFLPGTSIKVYVKTIHLYMRMGMIDRALEVFSRSQRDYPGHDGLLYLSAKICEFKGENEKALDAYRSLTSRSPDNADIRNSLGCTYEKLGRFDEAFECFREAKRLAPDNARIAMNLGIVEDRLGMTAEAERHLREAVARDEEYGPAFNALGCHLAGRERFGDAIRCFDQAVRLEPANALFHMNLALACEKVDLRERAAEAHERASRLESHNLAPPQSPRLEEPVG
jgi:Flp pilus assembly protein TadD